MKGAEFRPGHPVVFWLAIVALVFGMYSAATAIVTYHDCNNVGDGDKHWRVIPPEWVCDG